MVKIGVKYPFGKRTKYFAECPRIWISYILLNYLKKYMPKKNPDLLKGVKVARGVLRRTKDYTSWNVLAIHLELAIIFYVLWKRDKKKIKFSEVKNYFVKAANYAKNNFFGHKWDDRTHSMPDKGDVLKHGAKWNEVIDYVCEFAEKDETELEKEIQAILNKTL